jgi:hypothetical protein
MAARRRPAGPGAAEKTLFDQVLIGTLIRPGDSQSFVNLDAKNTQT